MIASLAPLLAGFALGGAHAQDGAEGDRAPAPETWVWVTDSATGKGVSRASVWPFVDFDDASLPDIVLPATQTDFEGVARLDLGALEGLDPRLLVRAYHVEVAIAHPLYAPLHTFVNWGDGLEGLDPIEVNQVSLEPGRTLVVRARDAEGRPVAGAGVKAGVLAEDGRGWALELAGPVGDLASVHGVALMAWDPALAEHADPNGNIALDILAWHPRAGGARGTGAVTKAKFGLGGPIDLTLAPAGKRLSGHFEGPDGAPVGLRPFVVTGPGLPYPAAYLEGELDAQGAFDLWVPTPGEWSVNVGGTEVAVECDQAATHTLRGPWLRVRLTDAEGAAIPVADLETQPDRKGARATRATRCSDGTWAIAGKPGESIVLRFGSWAPDWTPLETVATVKMHGAGERAVVVERR